MGRNAIEGRYESRKEGSYEYEVISKRWGGGIIQNTVYSHMCVKMQ